MYFLWIILGSVWATTTADSAMFYMLSSGGSPIGD